jgi:hypothetical protein
MAADALTWVAAALALSALLAAAAASRDSVIGGSGDESHREGGLW